MPKVDVYDCDVHGEYEYVDYVGPPPRCPECGKIMKYVATYQETED